MRLLFEKTFCCFLLASVSREITMILNKLVGMREDWSGREGEREEGRCGGVVWRCGVKESGRKSLFM